MIRHSHIVRALILAAALSPAIAAGIAQAGNISFVSTAGSDANACAQAAPCRTLQRAMDVTPDGGEVRIIDSGQFGMRTRIRKSLTISGGGNTVLLANPIIIRATGAVVTLRGLTLNGRSASIDGIVVESLATVHIEDCLIQGFGQIHGFGGRGIDVVDGGDGEVFVVGTTVRDNSVGLTAHAGKIVRISNSTFTANGRGIDVQPGAAVETRGNNTIRGNEINIGGTGTLTPFAGK